MIEFGKLLETKNTKNKDQKVGDNDHRFKDNVTEKGNICVIEVQGDANLIIKQQNSDYVSVSSSFLKMPVSFSVNCFTLPILCSNDELVISLIRPS